MSTRGPPGLHQLSLCGVNAPWLAVQLALGEDPGEVEPPFLGQDYTVVAGPRQVRPVQLPQQRAEEREALLPVVPAPVKVVEAAAEVLPL